MLKLLAALLMAAQPLDAQLSPDSGRAATRLTEFVDAVAASNARIPDRLKSYSARVETEFSMIMFSPDGPEKALTTEQLASNVYWRADGGLRQDVVGYRSQSIFAAMPMASANLHAAFITPTLFGERLELHGLATPRSRARMSKEWKNAVHPFGPIRTTYYEYSGGDTVQTIRLRTRDVPIVRIEVRPQARIGVAARLFTGHVDVDATRMQIVRMQGRIVLAGPDPPFNDDILQGNIFVDVESAEYDGEFWLPSEQRFEFQMAWVAFTESRVVIREISRFFSVTPNDSTAIVDASPMDTVPFGRVTGMDDQGALSGFSDWQTSFGSLGASAGARDFDQFAPHAGTTRLRVTFGARYFSQIMRYNGIEGMFSGAGLKVGFGAIAPGLGVRVHGGYAWREQVVRGGASVFEQRGTLEVGARAERRIAWTRDLTGIDGTEPDAPQIFAGSRFFDQKLAGLFARRNAAHGFGWRVELSRVSDRVAGRDRSQFGPEFPNDSASAQRTDSSLARAVYRGTYWLMRGEVRLNPSAGVLSVDRGLQLRALYERAEGAFEWHRLELGASVRRTLGRVTAHAGVDAGIVRSAAPPPQALYQLRRVSDFVTTKRPEPFVTPKGTEPFTGDRGASARASVMYTLPFLNAPFRVARIRLPGIAPSPYAGIRYGWTDAERNTVPLLERFGWKTSNGVRATAEFGLQFFGGGVGVGAFRPIDAAAQWQFGLRGGIGL